MKVCPYLLHFVSDLDISMEDVHKNLLSNCEFWEN